MPSTTTGGSSASAAVPSSRGTEAQPILPFLSARLRRGSGARNGGSGELQRHGPIHWSGLAATLLHCAIPQELCLWWGCGTLATTPFLDNKPATASGRKPNAL